MGDDVSKMVPPAMIPTLVQYGTSQGGPYQFAEGTSETYNQIYNFTEMPNINYTSPRIHHVRLVGELFYEPASSLDFVVILDNES
jgi:hypothetical protein